MEEQDKMPFQAAGPRSEVDHLRHFMRERFHSEPEAASFIGGPVGLDATLNSQEFARALRLSGYGRDPEPLFARFGQPVAEGGLGGSAVLVRDLLGDCDLPREPVPSSSVFRVLGSSSDRGSLADSVVGSPGSRLGGASFVADLPGRTTPSYSPPPGRDAAASSSVTFHPPAAATVAVEDIAQLEEQLHELRGEVADLQAQLQTYVAQERQPPDRGRDVADVDPHLRQLTLKVEETMAREANALRVEGAELRTSVAEAMRLFAEFETYATERLQRLEVVAQEGRQGSMDIRAVVKDVLGSGEFSGLGDATPDEVRQFVAKLPREQLDYRAMMAEMEGQMHRFCEEAIAELHMQVKCLDEGLQLRLETHTTKVSNLGSRLDDVIRELHGEANVRKMEVSQLEAQLEHCNAAIVHARTMAQERMRLDNFAGAAAVEPMTAQLPTAGSVALEQRQLRQSLLELQERVGRAEARQKSTEERTVSMLDTIMNGLLQ